MSTLEVLVERGRATVSVAGRKGPWSGVIELQSPEELRDALSGLPGYPDWPGAQHARVVFRRGIAQQRTLVGLPRMRRGILQELVAAQHARYFRRRGDLPPAVAARWLPEVETGVTRAQAVAVDATWLEAVHEGLEACRIRVLEITVEGSGLCLEAASLRVRKRVGARRWARRLGLACVVVWMSAGVTYTARLRQKDRELAQRLAVLDAPSRALSVARRELAGAAAAVEAVRVAREQSHEVARTLAQVVGALPDSSYLTALELNAHRSGTLSASTQNASAMIAGIERSLRVAVALSGDPAPDPSQAGWERLSATFGSRP